MSTFHFYLFLLALVMSTSTCSQNNPSLSSEIIEKLDSIATVDVPQGAPGVAVGVVKHGEIVYIKYAGFADLNDSILINKSSRFNIASNGKQFTALAILDLIENDKIDLNDDIRTFFPQLFPTINTPITIAHLLNHSSGIRDVYDLWSLKGITWWEHSYSMNDAMEILENQRDLNFNPGSQHSYSNSNYILLAEIIGIVSGSNFIDFTNQIFSDLGMPHTSFINDHTQISGSIAKPYFNFDSWFGYEWIWNIYGDGNIFSTLEDQLTWEKILQTKENKRFSKDLLTKSQSLLPNTTIHQYGYGLEFKKHKGVSYKYHGGSTGAWKAISMRFPTQDLSIVTLTNSGKTDPMTQSLRSADVLLNLKSADHKIKLNPDNIGPYVSIDEVLGFYEINGSLWQFEKRDGELYLLRSGRNDTRLVREADNIFQQWNDPPFKQEFSINEEGEMQVTAYYTRTPTFTLTRIKTDYSGFDFTSINGKYLNKETGVSFHIKYLSDNKYEVSNDENKLNAILLSKEELVINDYNYRFKITPTIDENSPQLLLDSGRILNVKFSRE